ncbi:MAG: family 78 glycoside hydrolase catalytic domain [Eubacteriales bacterium]|nr:family 78 glycoside hydrolase catalytic domain [Eubacteriales bacterium]
MDARRLCGAESGMDARRLCGVDRDGSAAAVCSGMENTMLEIRKFTCENLAEGCVTDERTPHFSYAAQSERQGAYLVRMRLSVNGWQVQESGDAAEPVRQIAIPYQGAPLSPFTEYEAQLQIWDDAGETAVRTLRFETGRLDAPWQAQWISDPSYSFTEKRVSPVPMMFRRRFAARGEIRRARLYATAMGIYELCVNGQKAGDEYFAPGFTSYRSRLQYQTYDVTGLLQRENEIAVTVGGGWAVGSFVFTRKNRISADRQALLLELRMTYEDGSEEIIGTDAGWEVTEEGPYREADFYDGETYDATVDPEKIHWRAAAPEKLRVRPVLFAANGAPVRVQERMEPVSCVKTPQGLVCDFGQNFAGVVELTIEGEAGQEITVRHAELLRPDGTLQTDFLRTAKATARYICRKGRQIYSPRMTYMGFRYVCVEGIEPERVQVAALALSSDIGSNGEFRCSSDQLNRLQQNIRWSARSNFMDIPTDCPQRDERMGWTGDIAVFAPTACYNYDMSRFLDKWLADMEAEQLPTGGIPNTIPAQGYGFPATMPTMAVDFWGDACLLVPWAEYQARGDRRLLENYYPMMKKYVDACRFWAGLFSVGKRRYLWHTPSVLHFGDWVAPDSPQMSQWQRRSKWTATASLCHTSGLLSQIARILGREDDAVKYGEISEKTAQAYCDLLTDGNGRLKEEFQSAYVLPLYFRMFPPQVRQKAADRLAQLVEQGNYTIGTGFPGTPYILFALADNGRVEDAYRMLLCEECPSWLYEVRMGATTIWERWDGLDESGNCPIGDDGTDTMISYNHYASGAVGDFLYRRVAGIEATEPGYRAFRIRPLWNEKLCAARGSLETPYGRIVSDWTVQERSFYINVEVPVGCVCSLELPDGSKETLQAGIYGRTCELPAGRMRPGVEKG